MKNSIKIISTFQLSWISSTFVTRLLIFHFDIHRCHQLFSMKGNFHSNGQFVANRYCIRTTVQLILFRYFNKQFKELEENIQIFVLILLSNAQNSTFNLLLVGICINANEAKCCRKALKNHVET